MIMSICVSLLFGCFIAAGWLVFFVMPLGMINLVSFQELSLLFGFMIPILSIIYYVDIKMSSDEIKKVELFIESETDYHDKQG